MKAKNEIKFTVDSPLTLVRLDEVYDALKKQDVPETAEVTFYQSTKGTDFTVAARWEVEL